MFRREDARQRASKPGVPPNTSVRTNFMATCAKSIVFLRGSLSFFMLSGANTISGVNTLSGANTILLPPIYSKAFYNPVGWLLVPSSISFWFGRLASNGFCKISTASAKSNGSGRPRLPRSCLLLMTQRKKALDQQSKNKKKQK